MMSFFLNPYTMMAGAGLIAAPRADPPDQPDAIPADQVGGDGVSSQSAKENAPPEDSRATVCSWLSA